FRNLSEYLIGGIILTLFLLGFTWLLSMLFSDFCDSLDASRYNWQHRFRNWLGVEPGNYLPSVFWLRLLAGLSLWGGSMLILLRIWNVSSAKRAELLAYVTDGFSIGEVTIIPARIILALIILVILMSLVSRLKKQLDEHWLQKARMEAGARNAVASITAYTAAAIAIIVALSFAGVELSNLAIIAGALSVGIGFGLQNIVNNFVSGLILLFERPIQIGDWIVVGNTEGYVQKISIRSTQIQTFDRADVIVPNSELISAQVTNWMLHDLRGRVRVPIGVAYGSDVEKVKKILLKIAHEQSGVILDGSVTPPKVLFLGFGDSALNFELRYIIRNVDEKLQTLSDTNFAIDKAFQENDISIPFPQRDLHIRNWDPDRAKLDSTD
ncbi:MAG: mechanosensitive ion channel, partial [Gammaproteobacteria bacterium]|nr:mechanosensitive ion channel [Gammaproteobacteria bacterium]